MSFSRIPAWMSAFVIVRNRMAAEFTGEIVNPFEFLPERPGEQKGHAGNGGSKRGRRYIRDSGTIALGSFQRHCLHADSNESRTLNGRITPEDLLPGCRGFGRASE